MIPVFLILFFTFAISINFLFKRRPKNYPPGPLGFPIIGHIPLLGIKPYYITLDKWKDKYGPVFSFEVGNKNVVTISGSKLIKETLNDPILADRPELPGFLELRGGVMKGVGFTSGPFWSEQRRFTLKNLGIFGLGKKSIEGLINEEVEDLIGFFRSQNGKPVSTENKFNPALINTLWTLIFGEKFKQDDPELAKMTECLTLFVKGYGFLQILLIIPIFEKFSFLNGMNALREHFKPLHDFMQKKILDHNKSYLEEEPRDFLDIYMDKIKKTTDSSSSFYKENGAESELIFTFLDIIFGGIETTSTTLCWIFLYLSVFPKVQEKLQREIKEVTGNSRSPKLEDRQNMPYTEAVFTECLRFSTILPSAIPRITAEDIEIAGFNVPKNTWIFPNMWSVHFDESIWGDPFNFRPERFLSKDGKSFVKSDHIFAFGSGKRVCLGEALARDEVFLFVTGIFQNFNVTFDPSQPKPTVEPNAGFLLTCKKHKLVFSEIN